MIYSAPAVSISAHDGALAAARQFVGVLRDVDRAGRRSCRTIPTEGERRAIREAFLGDLAPALGRAERSLDANGTAAAQEEVAAILNPWMLRSAVWARCFLKPHGYAGDFRTLEALYDLELSECADPTQPAVVNALDGLGRSVAGVRALWERRRWVAGLIDEAVAQRAGDPVRVLDVACGGSRPLRDVIGRRDPAGIEATLLDQDPGALAFVRSWLPAPALACATFLCGSARRLGDLLRADAESGHARFDIVVAAGLFDYLGQTAARTVLGDMAAVTRPGGTVAISNAGPDDASRVIRDWISDWRLIYRTPLDLTDIFGDELVPTLRRSSDGGLLFATAVL
ncbi:MAG TPA: class I SAM-dependent methyltransferase [Solirubrobacteraceae bacterium]|jgi:SAM-dependent methyltransferase|nr:class I SAM-dependent methyltransferase [Solirubrobacteraceae bacterium]